MQEEPLHEFIKFLFKTSIVVLLGYELVSRADASVQNSESAIWGIGIFFGGIFYKLIASPLVEGVDRFVDWFRDWTSQVS